MTAESASRDNLRPGLVPAGPVSRSWTRWDLAALAAIVAIAVAIYHRVVLGGEILFARDVLPYIVPGRAYASERFLSGEMPLWNPNAFCGMPFIADISNGVFDPIQLLFSPLPAIRAVSFAVVAYHILAATGAYVLGRRLGCGPAAALIAGVVFGFSGYLISMDDSVFYLAGVAWTPWVLWAVDRLCGKISYGRLLTVAGLHACVCLTGDVQWTYVMALMSVGYAAVASDPGRRLRTAGWVTLAGTVALMLTAFQLLPFAEVAFASRRATGLDVTESLSWAMHPLRIVELGVPTPFGAVGDDQTFWARGLVNNDHGIPWSQGIYLGIGALMFCTVAWRSKRARFFFAVTTVGLLLALGPHTPVGEWAQALPLWSSFRYPEKMIAMITFGLAMASGLGVQQALHGRRWLGPTVVFVVLAIAWLACLVFRADILSAVSAHIETHGVRHVVPDDATSRIIDALLWVLGLSGAITGMLALHASKRVSKRSTVITITMVLIFDLLLQASAIQRTVPAEPFTDDVPLARLAEDSQFPEAPGRLYRYDLPFLVAQPIEPSMLNTAASLWQWQTLRPNMGYLNGVQYTLGYGVGMSRDFEALWQTITTDEDLAFTLTATEHLLGLMSADDYANRARYEPLVDIPGQNVRLLRFRKAVPRVRVVYDIIGVSSHDEALEALIGADFDPARSVVVTGADDQRSEREPTKVEVIRADPEHIAVQVSTTADGVLLVADSWNAGWRARVDGKPVDIEHANYLFRAVGLSAGEHTVEMEFSPTSWRVGRAVSAATALIVVLGFALSRRSPRRGARGDDSGEEPRRSRGVSHG